MACSNQRGRTAVTTTHDKDCNVPNERNWERQQCRPDRPIVAVFAVGRHEYCPNHQRDSDDDWGYQVSPRSSRRR
jgi:hypothetical protein